MSEEYISRKSVRDAIASLSIERFELTPAYRLYVEALDNVDKKIVQIPAADVAPVRHGRWIIKNKHIYQCNRCGNYLDIRGLNGGRGDANYCPNCGAKVE